jgi:hypothetical protein
MYHATSIARCFRIVKGDETSNDAQPAAGSKAPAMSAHDQQSLPWDPQSGEGSQAFAAFRAYLELGAARSIPRAARTIGKSSQLLHRWSTQHGWVKRALAWDAHLAQQRDESKAADRRELVRRRLRRAREEDAVSRALTRAGVRPDLYGADIPLKPEDCLRYGERYARLATEIEDRALADDGGKESTADPLEELSLLDDPALRRIVEQARRAEHDHEETNSHETRETDDEASERPPG